MKVKSSNYHTSANNQGAGKHPSQSIHQPVLSSSHNNNNNHVMSSSYKEKSSVNMNKGGSTSNKASHKNSQPQSHHNTNLPKSQFEIDKTQLTSQQQQQQHQQHQQQQYVGQLSSAQQQNQQAYYGSAQLGSAAMMLLETQNQQQQTPNQGKNQTKIVNLSFAGQEFHPHRNMSSSMHNGFYVNAAAMEEATGRKHHNQMSNKQPQSFNNPQSTSGAANTMGGSHQQQQMMQQQQHLQASGGPGSSSNNGQNGTGSLVYYNVSSKNQQRRKISSTNQSTQFQTSGNQLLQNTINYPHTIKKKSSKAKMLVGADGTPIGSNGAQQMISAFPGGSHHNSNSMTRTQTSKLQQQNFNKGRGIIYNDMSEDTSGTQDASNNVFMQQDNRLAGTLGRAQQQIGQSQQSNMAHQQMDERNLFGLISGQGQQQSQLQQQSEGQQVMYHGSNHHNMHGYIASKQMQGMQTPSGFKQVAIVQTSNGQENYAFIEGSQKFVMSNPGQNNLRAKTMAPSMGLQVIHQPGGQTITSQHHLIQTQGSAKMNKNYMKVTPQYELAAANYAKSQQRSYKNLQAHQLSLLNQAQAAPMQSNGQSQVQQQSSQQQVANNGQGSSQAFVYGRKLVSMKGNGAGVVLDSAGNPVPLNLSTQGSQDQKTVGAKQGQQYATAQFDNTEGGLKSSQMQPIYGGRMIPAQNNNGSANQHHPIMDHHLQMVSNQRQNSVQPQFELDPIVGNVSEQLTLNKINSQQNQQGKPIVINQAHIQYATRDATAINVQQQDQLTSNSQTYNPPQSAQKNTNLIVRIDNSNAANHQITKRKRLKDGGSTAMRNGAGNQNGEPSESEAMSEAGPTQSLQHAKLGGHLYSQMDKDENLPNFNNHESETGSVMGPIRDMANSAQNFNPMALGGPIPVQRISINHTAENNGLIDGSDSATIGGDGRILSKIPSRNETLQPISGKPSSAVMNKRTQLQSSGQSRPESKQGANGQVMSAKKRFDQELQARDALIGIDDEDELVAHHEDFSENSGGKSQISAGDQSNDELNLNYNKSVDSDKLGKSGSISFRQVANLKSTAQTPGQISLAQTPGGSTVQQLKLQNQSSYPGPGSTNQQAQAQAQQQHMAAADSDIESELSGSTHQHQMFVYSNTNASIQQNQSYNQVASDSDTDGNFSDTGSCFGRGTTMRDEDGGGLGAADGIDGISEHSSDEADSESEEVMPDGKKKEKVQGEKPPKKKKKKNQDDKEVKVKKTKGDKENVAANKKGKEKAHTAPSKKNFAEAQEKDYNTKGKQREAPKTKQQQQGKDQSNKVKPDKKQEKASKGSNDPPIKVKKPKQPTEESKGGSAAAAADLKESPQKKKPKQKLNLALAHCQPKNIEESKIAFFESGCTVNPVFEYENDAAAAKFLAQFKEPSDELLDQSKKILDSFIEQFGSESAYLEQEGEIVSREETLQVFNDYNEALEFEELLSVQFKVNQVAPTSVTHDPKTGKSRVNIRDPPEYRRGRLYGVIDHEIGTHFMRKFNERFQVWYKKRDKYELKSCIQTEEGFACVNQLVRTAWAGTPPYLFRSSLNYYAAYMASKMSFVELFNDIEKYVDSRMSRWKFVLRLKRGLIETSEPGGLYKDQCYLEGAIQFLQQRHTIDIHGLFCGKISLEDLNKPKIQKVLNKESIKLPTFVQDMDRYMGALDIIARTNHIPPKPTE